MTKSEERALKLLLRGFIALAVLGFAVGLAGGFLTA